MVKISVIYPNAEGTTFDVDYYRDTHMALVQQHLKPHGLIKVGIDKGLGGGQPGDPPPFHCIGSLYFESEEAYRTAMASVGSVLRDDIPNFTNVTPLRLISEVME